MQHLASERTEIARKTLVCVWTEVAAARTVARVQPLMGIVIEVKILCDIYNNDTSPTAERTFLEENMHAGSAKMARAMLDSMAHDVGRPVYKEDENGRLVADVRVV
jgi:hypothetical protein